METAPEEVAVAPVVEATAAVEETVETPVAEEATEEKKDEEAV